MIDIRVLRADADAVKAALARRGVEASEVDAILEADAAWSARVAQAEAMRAEVKDLSRQVGQARKAGDDALAAELREQRQTGLLYLPNIPAEDAPDGDPPVSALFRPVDERRES